MINSDDVDLYVSWDNVIGIVIIDSGYFGEVFVNSWYCIVFVFYVVLNNGVLKIYFDGELIGFKDEGEIDECWVINNVVLFLIDNDYEIKLGYLNVLLFVGCVMIDVEIVNMGVV